MTSEMSNTRMPRTRSLLTGSGTPSKPQSVRLLVASDDMKSRFAVDRHVVLRRRTQIGLHQRRLDGLEMS